MASAPQDVGKQTEFFHVFAPPGFILGLGNGTSLCSAAPSASRTHLHAPFLSPTPMDSPFPAPSPGSTRLLDCRFCCLNISNTPLLLTTHHAQALPHPNSVPSLPLPGSISFLAGMFVPFVLSPPPTAPPNTTLETCQRHVSTGCLL